MAAQTPAHRDPSRALRPCSRVAQGLREPDHEVRVALSGIGALSGAVLEVIHRLDEVTGRQTRDAGIFRPALAVWIMAEAARKNIRFLAPVLHNGRHRRMIIRIPVGRPGIVTNLS